ncbi:iduronate 2-sulfatase-like [Penaeus japonicus]|uniref:iduronate 2-sulfatase-like n=1 Tax=Penaeus japonicus TaxID=27405 RepID=UPI001C7173A6|nr:iduronate 2-sulfatase-like [Penaeus japonicus]XP_042855307.1 iduronate 2-sulfatase-like [Penaeus japonicus]XP_042855308.1 iduronate 2-sulfatase-like [Penaeus japonicus]
MILYAAVLLLITGSIEVLSSSGHPNVLLIVVDDLRPSLGCYGDPVALTPNIDALARKGILFTKAFAQQALCGPSRTSFLTSRRPDTTKLYDVHSYWRNHAGNFTTLPQYFKEHGYHTVSAGKVFHPGIVSNKSDDQPYSWSETPYHPPTQAFKQDPVCLGPDGGLYTNIYCPVQVEQQPGGSLPDIQTTEFATSWLQEWALKQESGNGHEKQPFFLAVGYHKPHIPLKFPLEFLDAYPIANMPLAPNRKRPPGLPTVAWNPWNDLRRRHDINALNVSYPYGPIPDSYARYIRQGYYGATTYTDSLVGDLLGTVSSLFPDTVVALIGDHGWALGEHQEWSKFSNFEVATKVPFIVARLNRQSAPLFNGFSKIFKKTNSIYMHPSFDNLQFSTLYKTQLKSRLSDKPEMSSFRKKSVWNSSSLDNRSPHIHNGLVELVDLFPTLVDLAGISALFPCPDDSRKIKVCTEGSSLSPLIKQIWDLDLSPYSNKTQPRRTLQGGDSSKTRMKVKAADKLQGKKAAFSQYPRPGLQPSVEPDSDQPRLHEIKVMGYSMRTNRYRYTVWLKFNNVTFLPDWDHIVSEELYDHKVDPDENFNLCRKKVYRHKKKHLKRIFIQGWRQSAPSTR